MNIKNTAYLFAISLILMCSGFVAGQNKIKSVGIISLEIASGEYSSKKMLDVPVNEKLPLLSGDGLRIEQSETGNVWQLNSVAVADRDNVERAYLKVTLTVAQERGKTKVVQKKLTLAKGQSRNFRIKYKNFQYEITAIYKAETKSI